MMKLCPHILTFAVLLLSTVTAWGATVHDEGEAREYCDTTALHRIEGIWEFPDDQTRVLISRRQIDNAYDIIVVDTPDCRMAPGDIIGNVKPSAQPGTYEMSISRMKVKGVFSDPGKCKARLADNESSLSFTTRKLSVNIGNLYLLPRFWRLFRFKIKDVEIPQGMVRVYPVPYGSKVKEPIYL